MEQCKKRIEFIDLAKGVCIILVVLFHVGVELFPWVVNLRMPLYFILSGLFFKDYGGFKYLFIKKVNKIFIPFLFFYLVSYILFYVCNYASPGLIKTDAKGILDIFTQRILFNNPIWFLVCLFWCNLLFCIISLSVKQEWFRGLIICIIGLGGFLLIKNDVKIYCAVDCTFTALPFFYFGYLLKKTDILYPNKYDTYNLLIAIGFFIIVLLLRYLCPSAINFQQNEYSGVFIVSILTSIACVMSVLYLCKILKRIPIISYFGRYSIIVLCTHHLVYRPIRIIMWKLGLVGNVELACTALGTLLVCFGLIPLCIKFIPYFTAQKDIIKLSK